MFYRDLLVLSATGNTDRLSSPDMADRLSGLLAHIDERGLTASLDAVLKAKRAVLGNSDFLLALETLLIKLKENLI